MYDKRIFKNYRSLVTQEYKKSIHNGVDLVGEGYTLDYVCAHSDGVVIAVENNYNKTDTSGRSYGNYVKIDHGNGYATLYAHLKYNSVPVKFGDKVKKGDVIGYMGNTGYSMGSHTHFEVFYLGEKINPMEYIDSDLPITTQTEVISEEFKVGDRVLVLNGYLTADSFGGGSTTASYDGNENDTSNIKYITIICKGRPRPYHLSNDIESKYPRGWAKESQIRKI